MVHGGRQPGFPDRAVRFQPKTGLKDNCLFFVLTNIPYKPIMFLLERLSAIHASGRGRRRQHDHTGADARERRPAPNGLSVKARPPHGTNAEGTGAPVRKGSARWLRGWGMEATGRTSNNS